MFPGFTAADFDVYEPKKWRSNVFNRERLEVKQKLIALGRELAPGLSGLDGSPLQCEASVEHPALWNHKQVEAQHLFFSRSEGARKELDKVMDRARSIQSMIEDPTPQRTHIFLCLSVTHAGLEVALRLHPDARVDRQNLARKCADLYERQRFVELCAELPAGLELGVSSGARVAAGELDEARLAAVLAELDAVRPAPMAAGPWFTIERRIARDAAVALGGAAEAELKATLDALLPAYWFIAWSQDNDYVSMKETIQKEKTAKLQRGLAKNDKVRIVRGVLAGKTGVVQGLDKGGGVRLLVGKLAVKLDAADVDKT